MSTSTCPVSIRIIHGIISFQPKLHVNCGLEEVCGVPCLGRTEESIAIESLRGVQDNFELLRQPENDELFWKKKLIVQVSLSPYIISVSFIPYSLNSSVSLFFQKIDQITETVGFVAPYLSEEERKVWQAEPGFSTCYQISDEASVGQTIGGLEEGIRDEIKTCLQYFLNDTTSSAIGLTFVGPDQTYISCGWIKS